MMLPKTKTRSWAASTPSRGLALVRDGSGDTAVGEEIAWCIAAVASSAAKSVSPAHSSPPKFCRSHSPDFTSQHRTPISTTNTIRIVGHFTKRLKPIHALCQTLSVEHGFVSSGFVSSGSPTGAVSTDAVSTDAVSTDVVSTDAVSTDAVSTDAVSTDAVSTGVVSTGAVSSGAFAPAAAPSTGGASDVSGSATPVTLS